MARVVETQKVGVAVVGKDHCLQWVNDAFASIIGYKAAELIGLTFAEITYPEDNSLDSKLASRLLTGICDKYETEKRYLHRDGSIIPIHLTVTTVRDRRGEILYSLSIVERIAARKALHVNTSVPVTTEESELDRIRRAVLGG